MKAATDLLKLDAETHAKLAVDQQQWVQLQLDVILTLLEQRRDRSSGLTAFQR
jgi:hypothetical protein